MSPTASRIEPSAALLDGVHRWLVPVRAALGDAFLSAYVTGSALTEGFDPTRRPVNVLVIVRDLPADRLDGLAAAIPRRTQPAIEPLFMTHDQMRASLDVFPIEWEDVVERHLRLEGADAFEGLEVPRTYLRLQLEHELRGKHLRLRQEYLAAAGDHERLVAFLARMAGGFDALFRTLLRLEGEPTPANPERVIERVSD